MDNLDKNLQEELKNLMFKSNVEELRESIVDEESEYSEQLDMLVEIAALALQILNKSGEMLNDFKVMEDSTDEIRNLMSQEMLLDLIQILSEIIVLLKLPKNMMEEFVDSMSMPPKFVALNLATSILGRMYK